MAANEDISELFSVVCPITGPCTENTRYPDAYFCDTYCFCFAGVTLFARFCPFDLLYDLQTRECLDPWENDVNCEDRCSVLLDLTTTSTVSDIKFSQTSETTVFRTTVVVMTRTEPPVLSTREQTLAVPTTEDDDFEIDTTESGLLSTRAVYDRSKSVEAKLISLDQINFS